MRKHLANLSAVLVVALAVILGLAVAAAAAAADFSADWVQTMGKRQTTGKIFVQASGGNAKTRLELTEQGETSITIARFDLKVAWQLMADNNYMEIKLPFDPQNNTSEEEFDQVNLGTAVVDGRTCDATQYVFKDKRLGSTILWIAKDLGVAIRTESRDAKGKVVSLIEYKNVSLEALDDALFELPPGAQKFELPFGLNLPGTK